MTRPPLDEIEKLVLQLSAEEFGVELSRLTTETRPVQDLGIDSLDIAMWFMDIEDRFQVSLPAARKTEDQAYKSVFTREDFTLGDMAEAIYLRWGSGSLSRQDRSNAPSSLVPSQHTTQLGGVYRSR